MQELRTILNNFLDASLLIVQWQILSAHPELWSEQGIQILTNEHKTAWGQNKFKRLYNISCSLLLFEQCSKVGPEIAYFGKVLDKNALSLLKNKIEPFILGKANDAQKLLKTGNREGCIEILEQLLSGIKTQNSPFLSADLHSKLAGQYFLLPMGNWSENLEKSIEHYNNALKVFTSEAFPKQWAEIQSTLADIYWERVAGRRSQNLEKSIDICESVLGTIQPEIFPELYARTKSIMATTYLYRICGNRAGNIERAIELLSDSIKIYNKEMFPEFWAKTSTNLSSAYYYQIRGDRAENLEKSIKYLESSLSIFTSEITPEDWAKTKCGMALVYGLRLFGDRAENLDKAIDLYEEVFKVFTRDNFRHLWAITKFNLADYYKRRISGQRKDNLEKALSLIDEALEILTPDIFPEYRAIASCIKAEIYLNRIKGERAENIENAITLINEILKIYKHDSFPEQWAKTLKLSGDAYSQRLLGSSKENLDSAVKQFTASLQVNTPETFPRECRETAMKLMNVLMRTRDWTHLLKTAETAKNADSVLQRQAVSVVSRGQEIEESANLYYLASYACAQLNDPLRAFEWLEQGKTRELGEALDRSRAIFQDKLKHEDRLSYLEKIDLLMSLEAEQRGVIQSEDSFSDVVAKVREINAELDQLIEKIRHYIPEFLREIKITQKEIELLFSKENIAYILFNVTDYGTLIILLVRPDSQLVFKTFLSDEFNTSILNEFMRKWALSLNKMKLGAWKDSEHRFIWWKEVDDFCRKTYRCLFSSVHGWLKEHDTSINNLVFVPHLSLHNLPLHLMKYTSENGPKYLLEDFEISFSPSLSVILKNLRTYSLIDRSKARRYSPSSLLIVSNPSQDLVWSEEESKLIEDAFPNKKLTLANKNATKERLIQNVGESDLLHFSCHGEFDVIDPWNSGLVLASETEKVDNNEQSSKIVEKKCSRDKDNNVVSEVILFEDGVETRVTYNIFGNVYSQVRFLPDGNSYIPGRGRLVTLKELITHLNLLNTQLVVLSACETGLVSFRGQSDEFVGLPGGFLRIGVKNVVASLWVVDDESTAFLMQSFYRYLGKEHFSPSMSLRLAQLDIMRNPKWKNPFYWGAFRNIGISTLAQ